MASEEPFYALGTKTVFGIDKIGWRVSLASVVSATMSYGYVRGAANLFTPMLEYQNNSTIESGNVKASMSDYSTTNAWILLGISLGATTCGYILPKVGNRNATIFC